MNFYEKELDQIRRNFDFSMKIYDRDISMQMALCHEEIQKLDKMKFPKIYSALYLDKAKLRDEIQAILFNLKEKTREKRGVNGK